MRAFIALGSVVLAVTGAEALYADMGHFGRKPIRISWLYFVLPALLLNYMGQGAMILSADAATALAKVKDPVLLPRARTALRLPLVLLATAATIIASQAVISGAFSVTQQAIQLGFIPRLQDRAHQRERGRADLHPGDQLGADDRWSSCSCCSSSTSSNLAAAYGIAVTGAMLIDTCLIAVVLLAAVELEPLAGDRRLLALFFARRLRLFRRQPAQDPRRRLVPAAGRRRSPSPCSPPGRRAGS